MAKVIHPKIAAKCNAGISNGGAVQPELSTILQIQTNIGEIQFCHQNVFSDFTVIINDRSEY